MKKLFLILVLVYLCIQIGISQIYISTNTRMLEVYNDRTNNFNTVREKYNDNGFFEINETLTLMTHITDSKASFYKMKNWKYNDERDTYEFDALSDVGNDYLMSIDLIGKTVAAIFVKDKKTYIASFDIKSVFTKD